MNDYILIKDCFSWRARFLATTMLCTISIISTHEALAKNSMSAMPEIDSSLSDTSLNNQVLLRRTSHGVVHVTASGYKGIGYGVGFAYTQDNRCLLAHRIAEVNGRLSEQLGAEAPVTSEVHDITYTALQSDHYYRGWFDINKIRTGFEEGAPEVRELAEGYAAGVNRFLKRHHNLASCPVKFKGEVTLDDVYRMWVATASIASGEVVAGLLPQVVPSSPLASLQNGSAKTKTIPATVEHKVTVAKTVKPMAVKLASVGSNAWAFGRDVTRKGNSVHLYNPHFPWAGPQRQYMVHITIPEELDVMGVTLGGFPVPFSGFTKNIAWGLTFSAAARWSLADLKLEGDPLSYKVDGVSKKITSETLSIPVLGENEPRQIPFYRAGKDPIIDADAFFFGWWNDPNNPGRAFVAHDVNADNTRIVEQFLRVAQAQNVHELQQQLEAIQGVPWSYVVASDADGEVYFGDVSAVPNISTAHIANCVVSAVGAFHLPHGIIVLDGTRDECGWNGLMPVSDLPQTVRSDYVANSNNTYELPNLEQRLTGFSPVLGHEGAPLDLRSNLGLQMIADRLDGSDGFGKSGFTRKLARKVFHQSRNRAGELLVDGIVADCKANPVGEYNESQVDLSKVCTALERWDRSNTIRSKGAAVFRGMWMALSDALVAHDTLFLIPASLDDPLNTPSGYTADPVIRTAVRNALARVAVTFKSKGISPKVRWGKVNKVTTPFGTFPMPGGFSTEGIFDSIVSSDAFYTFDGWSSTLDGNDPDSLYGASYLHAVSLGAKGPRAVGVLPYSQATEPTSPWYLDQVKRWSRNRWFKLPYTERQINRDPKLKVKRLKMQ
ncbi:MAG: penicillin acylase family protein [Methylococcales bacterium]